MKKGTTLNGAFDLKFWLGFEVEFSFLLKFFAALPMRIDDTGSQGETGHDRHGDSYTNIRRSRRNTPEPAAGSTSDERSTPPSPTDSSASFGKHDPFPSATNVDAASTQGREAHQWEDQQRNYSKAPRLFLFLPHHHHQSENPWRP